jgi:hypothetical protein
MARRDKKKIPGPIMNLPDVDEIIIWAMKRNGITLHISQIKNPDPKIYSMIKDAMHKYAIQTFKLLNDE